MKFLFPLLITLLSTIAVTQHTDQRVPGNDSLSLHAKEEQDTLSSDTVKLQETINWFMEHTTPHLAKLVEKGLKCIEEHPRHHLELGIREAIYKELGPHRDSGTDGMRGYRRRMDLAVSVINKVAPLWKATWPKDQTLESYLNKFHKLTAIQTERERKNLMIDSDRDWEVMTEWADNTGITDRQRRHHRFPESLVGLAVVRACELAGDDRFAVNNMGDLGQQDKIEDFMNEDLHFYAAFAWARGYPYAKEQMAFFDAGDPQKYKDFWKWWLLEALPAAY